MVPGFQAHIEVVKEIQRRKSDGPCIEEKTCRLPAFTGDPEAIQGRPCGSQAELARRSEPVRERLRAAGEIGEMEENNGAVKNLGFAQQDML